MTVFWSIYSYYTAMGGPGDYVSTRPGRRQVVTLCSPWQSSPACHWGTDRGKLSALVCSCILSQTRSQLICALIRFFFLKKKPSKPKSIIFPQQDQELVDSLLPPWLWV